MPPDLFSHWPSHQTHPPVSALEELSPALAQLGADSIMLWLDDLETDNLLSVYNPILPKLCGYRQSLNAGLISQVFLSGLSLLEKDLKLKDSHDPSFDEFTGCHSRSMIAAPVTAHGEIIGVLSATQFAESNHTENFTPNSLKQLAEITKTLGDSFPPLNR